MWDKLFPSATSDYSLPSSQKHEQPLIDGWNSHLIRHTLLNQPVTEPVCHESDERARLGGEDS